MPYSSVEVTALGDTNTFPVPFPYLNRADVHGYVDDAEVKSLTFLNAGLVRLPLLAASLAGRRVRIQRITPSQTAAVTFKPGALDHSDLNKETLQLLYVSQEAADRVALLPTPLPGNRYDFKGRRATNLGDPEAPRDATTRSWVEGRVAEAIFEAAVSNLFPTTAAAFRILFAGYLRSLPKTKPSGAGEPWLNSGLLALTKGGDPVTGAEQAEFNATFGPIFVSYLRSRPVDVPETSNSVWVNGGLVTLSD